VADARTASAALSGFMTEYLDLYVPEPDGISPRARHLLAVASMIILLMVVGVIEVGTLAAVTIVSSGQNHK
jgi:hypothetical protein